MLPIVLSLAALASSAASLQEPVSELEQELRFVTDNALAVAIIRPAKMMAVPGLAANPLADLAGPTGIKPSDVERLVIALVPAGLPEHKVGVLYCLQLIEPVDVRS